MTMHLAARPHAASPTPESHGLAALGARSAEGGPRRRADPAHPPRIYTSRAAPWPLDDLMNWFLPEPTSIGSRRLLVRREEVSHAAHRGRPEPERARVAERLGRECAAVDAGARERLFGPEGAPVPPEGAPVPCEPEPRMGSWGPFQPGPGPEGS